jgi:uncharacterized protein (TIGR03000 family)
MYSVILLAALTAGEGAPSHGWGFAKCNYGSCYGACYGVGYHGWGGWGLPYGGYGPVPGAHWPGYACWGGCGGYASPAYGYPMTPWIAPTPPAPPADAGKKDKDKDKDSKKGKDDEDEDTKKKDDKDKGKDDEKDKGTDKDKKDKDKKGKDDDEDKISAKVTFVLPEGATLHVDEQRIEEKAGVQTFRTPNLEKGRRYFYDVRVEVVRDGKPISASRRIIFRAGSDIRADFSGVANGTGVAVAEKR